MEQGSLPVAFLFRLEDDWRFAHQTGNSIARSYSLLLGRRGNLKSLRHNIAELANIEPINFRYTDNCFQGVFAIALDVQSQNASQSHFVTVQIDITGHRGPILGGFGQPGAASGILQAPKPDLVLWRILERVEIEKQLLERVITPAEDGQSVTYSYQVKGGGGGLFPLAEPGHFKAELTAVFAPPSYLTTVGTVEVLSTSMEEERAPGTPATVRKTKSASPAQLEGRLFRLPDDDDSPIYFVEHGQKRILESPTCGRLRFGDGWHRLIQTLASMEEANIVPDGPPLTVAESAEGRLVICFPDTTAYVIRHAQKHRIDAPDVIADAYGDHWRIKLIYLRRPELDGIPDGAPITTHDDLRTL